MAQRSLTSRAMMPGCRAMMHGRFVQRAARIPESRLNKAVVRRYLRRTSFGESHSDSLPFFAFSIAPQAELFNSNSRVPQFCGRAEAAGGAAPAARVPAPEEKGRPAPMSGEKRAAPAGRGRDAASISSIAAAASPANRPARQKRADGSEKIRQLYFSQGPPALRPAGRRDRRRFGPPAAETAGVPARPAAVLPDRRSPGRVRLSGRVG